jgi:uncharacterized protein DUF6295
LTDVCTHLTHRAELAGSGKGANGWFALTQANVYVDHPFDAPYEHTLNIDFADPAKGPAARVAVELTEEAALALVDAIKAALASAPPGIAAASPPATASTPATPATPATAATPS